MLPPKSPDELQSTIPEIFGYSVGELETQLRVYLSAFDTPDVGFTIPTEAETVFALADPAGDDVGDGDYAYPRDKRFAKGVFDLRKFEVRKDNGRAYFRLEFQSTMQPVSYGSSSEKFVPAAVIAINKSRPGERQLGRFCHGVQFENGQGFDLKINVALAVSVTNNYGKVYFSTPDVFDEMVDHEKNTITFSFPFDFIGEPEEDWQYFVGVGLTSDRTMNFLNAGPLPVYKNHPIFISGGKDD